MYQFIGRLMSRKISEQKEDEPSVDYRPTERGLARKVGWFKKGGFSILEGVKFNTYCSTK